MVMFNVGESPIERTEPYQVYRELVADLLAVEGVLAIVGASRYSLRVRGGPCFDPERVGARVAEMVARNLYPEESLTLEIAAQVRH
jgi:hypothetical protein